MSGCFKFFFQSWTGHHSWSILQSPKFSSSFCLRSVCQFLTLFSYPQSREPNCRVNHLVTEHRRALLLLTAMTSALDFCLPDECSVTWVAVGHSKEHLWKPSCLCDAHRDPIAPLLATLWVLEQWSECWAELGDCPCPWGVLVAASWFSRTRDLSPLLWGQTIPSNFSYFLAPVDHTFCAWAAPPMNADSCHSPAETLSSVFYSASTLYSIPKPACSNLILGVNIRKALCLQVELTWNKGRAWCWQAHA